MIAALIALAVGAFLLLNMKKKKETPAPTAIVLTPAQQFREKFRQQARLANLRGIQIEIALAVAGLETGWGSGNVFKKTNNLFNLKATPTWRGATYPATDGGAFRVYGSWIDSMNDWARWLQNSKIFKRGYAAAVGGRAYEVFNDFQIGGYAGADKQYAAKLSRSYGVLV